MSNEAVKRFCEIDEASRKILSEAARKINLSPRSYFRILKIARTIADLAGERRILLENVAEALQYRPKIGP